MVYFWGQKVKGQGQGQKVTFSPIEIGSPNLVGKFILTIPGLELILVSKGQKVKGQIQGQECKFSVFLDSFGRNFIMFMT